MPSKSKVPSESESRHKDFDMESSIHMNTVLLTAEEIKVRNQIKKFQNVMFVNIILINISSADDFLI